MNQSISSLFQVTEAVSPCTELFSATIHLQPGESSPESKWDVYLSLSADTYWKNLAGGRIEVSISRAELLLDVQNAKFIPSSGSDLRDASAATLMVIRKLSSDKIQIEIKPSGGLSLVTQSNGIRLGYLQVNHEPQVLTCTVPIVPRDVHIVNAEGLWRHDITPNKHGVIERRLIHTIAASDLAPCLSQTQISYRCTPASISDFNERATIDEEELEAIIHKVANASTSNLVELAKQASLNVDTDLAGGQFRGASLRGLDLSNVDLSYANLRGVDLTDAELSEADLSYAKLGGADLSGADLGRANLQHADLHKASLALANLSGADLSNADLRETNMSQTNFNGIHIKGAILSDNVGLDDEMRRRLIEKGAKLSV